MVATWNRSYWITGWKPVPHESLLKHRVEVGATRFDFPTAKAIGHPTTTANAAASRHHPGEEISACPMGMARS